MSWKLERDEYYFRILDKKKNTAGYFDPDYGRQMPAGQEEQIIDSLWERHAVIPGGYMTLGLAKFGIFGGEYRSDIDGIASQLAQVQGRITLWKKALDGMGIRENAVGISHTDQDMLALTIPVSFDDPVPLDKKEILPYLAPLLERLQDVGLV